MHTDEITRRRLKYSFRLDYFIPMDWMTNYKHHQHVLASEIGENHSETLLIKDVIIDKQPLIISSVHTIIASTILTFAM